MLACSLGNDISRSAVDRCEKCLSFSCIVDMCHLQRDVRESLAYGRGNSKSQSEGSVVRKKFRLTEDKFNEKYIRIL